MWKQAIILIIVLFVFGSQGQANGQPLVAELNWTKLNLKGKVKQVVIKEEALDSNAMSNCFDIYTFNSSGKCEKHINKCIPKLYAKYDTLVTTTEYKYTDELLSSVDITEKMKGLSYSDSTRYLFSYTENKYPLEKKRYKRKGNEWTIMGLTTFKTDRRGNIIQDTYYPIFDGKKQFIKGKSFTTEYTYNSDNRLEYLHSKDESCKNIYDANGRLIQILSVSYHDTTLLCSFKYDMNGNVIENHTCIPCPEKEYLLSNMNVIMHKEDVNPFVSGCITSLQGKKDKEDIGNTCYIFYEYDCDDNVKEMVIADMCSGRLTYKTYNFEFFE